MPRRPMDRQAVVTILRRTMSSDGPQSRQKLEQVAGVSQATISRLLRSMSDVVVLGKNNKAIEYGVTRANSSPVSIYEVDEDGTVREVAEMTILEPRHYAIDGQVSEGLPFFLNDLRPSGFLGRLVPRQNADLDLPEDIRLWSDEITLRYLASRAYDLVGNLLVSDRIAAAVQHGSFPKPPIIERAEFEKAADNVLAFGVPGSSAAGEHPKFLMTDPSGQQKIVKFSPPVSHPVGRRVADVLIAEHLALNTLAEGGISAAQTTIFTGPRRVFLEIERFDRIPHSTGRRGVISLASLSAHHLGDYRGWVEDAEKLMRHNIITAECLRTIRQLALFGQLIANSDMHEGNLSFFSHGLGHVTTVTPAYDMGPMLYAPRHLQIVDIPFEPTPRRHRDNDIWPNIFAMALTFWERVATDTRISKEFRAIAREARRRIQSLA